MAADKSSLVVFVHGMFMTPLCWEHWESHYRSRGLRTLAPPWPEHESSIDAQRGAHPNAKLGAVTLEQLVQHYRSILLAQDEKPFLVGHSLGGLLVQLLVSEGLARAGVAIDSAPPQGVISLKWSFLKSNWPAINPFAREADPIALSFEQFQYAFVNGLPPDEQKAAYSRYAVPESRRVGKGPTTAAAAIDFARPRPPLLFIAGSEDHIIPASLNRRNHAKYRASGSVTDFKEFAGRTHFIIGQRGWEEVADYALDWLMRQPSA